MLERQQVVGAAIVRDGRVLALWSFPSFDPNRLAGNSSSASNEAFLELDDA